MRINKIDGVNYRRGTMPSADGELQIEGMTVRALRKALDDADPDALIVYLAEQNGGLLIGCIGGAAMDSETYNLVTLFGPEAIEAVRNLGLREL
jgi:hypothetical protein